MSISKEFINYLKENKESLEKSFNDYYEESIPDIAQSYGSFDLYAEEAEEEGFEYSEYDWYESYGHTTGNQAEWDAAEWTLREVKLTNDEDHRGCLIEFLGYSTSYGSNNYYYKED